MPTRLDGLVLDVLGMLAEAEMQAFAFQRASGITCPAGCGTCCRGHHPEDSVLAALPAVRWALAQGWEERVIAAGREAPDGPCVFFDAEHGGHCAVYPLRPLICRLFGYAGVRDKHGRTAYRPCRSMIGSAPAGMEPPVFMDLAQRLEQRHPPLGDRHLPLNVAFMEAAAWVSLRR